MREKQILGAILDGIETKKAIAADLNIGIRTVDFHGANARRKMGKSTVTGAAVEAWRRGILKIRGRAA